MRSLRDDSFENFEIDGRLFALHCPGAPRNDCVPPRVVGHPRPGTAHQISMSGGDLVLSCVPNEVGTVRALVGFVTLLRHFA